MLKSFTIETTLDLYEAYYNQPHKLRSCECGTPITNVLKYAIVASIMCGETVISKESINNVKSQKINLYTILNQNDINISLDSLSIFNAILAKLKIIEKYDSNFDMLEEVIPILDLIVDFYKNTFVKTLL